jgi:hypothetical protein
MGVYSSVPTRVMPHTTTGRADYFGPMVNRAARYCHAAARGGQVLLSKELMCEVSFWLCCSLIKTSTRHTSGGRGAPCVHEGSNIGCCL